MELWDLYTEDRIKTGESHVRGNPLPKGRYHLVVNVWIKNSDGKYLISKRAKTRPKYPLKFEPVAGAILKNESSINGAVRETKEEIGVDLNLNAGKLVCTLNRSTINSILDVWLFKYDGEVDLKNATTDEVESVDWMSKEDIYQLCDSGLFVQHISEYLDKFFALAET